MKYISNQQDSGSVETPCHGFQTHHAMNKSPQQPCYASSDETLPCFVFQTEKDALLALSQRLPMYQQSTHTLKNSGLPPHKLLFLHPIQPRHSHNHIIAPEAG